MSNPRDITIEYRAGVSGYFFVTVKQGEHAWTGMGTSMNRARRDALRRRKREIKHDERYHGGRGF